MSKIDEVKHEIEKILGRKLTDEEVLIIGMAYQKGISDGIKGKEGE